MCDNPKNEWKPDNYDEDAEEIPRGLYRADLTKADYGVPRSIEFIGTTQEPGKIARAILAGKPPNLIGSKIHDTKFIRSSYHAPLLDFDGPTRVKKSSTRGHYHVLLDSYINEKDFAKAMHLMAQAGMVQEGFAGMLDTYKQVFLRWNHLKGDDET